MKLKLLTKDYIFVVGSQYGDLIKPVDEFGQQIGPWYQAGLTSTEMLSLDSWDWRERATFPYPIWSVRSVAFENNFLTFGGRYNGCTFPINELCTDVDWIYLFTSTTNTWSFMGSMSAGRRTPAVIGNQNTFLIAGDVWQGDRRVEKCTFENDQVQCENQNLLLADYGKKLIVRNNLSDFRSISYFPRYVCILLYIICLYKNC